MFTAAFIAGAAAAVGVNRALDVHLAQARPQVECEPIFVALRPLPQGAPVTVWDVALRDWPRAMLPTSALRAGDSFEGLVLRHPLREGQPLLAVQLVRPAAATMPVDDAVEIFTAPVAAEVAVVATPATRTPTPAAADAGVAAGSETDGSEADGRATAGAAGAGLAEAAAIPGDGLAPPGTPAQPVVASVASADIDPPTAMTDPGADAVEPAADEVSDRMGGQAATEPTPIAEADETRPKAVDPPLESVVTATETAGMPAPAPASPPVRYLVVPERIALQADALTAPPAQRPAPSAAPQPSPPAAVAAPARRQPAPVRSAPAARSNRPARVPAPPASGQSPQTQRRPSTPPEAAAKRPWGASFPAIAAGIEAMTSPWQPSRRPATTAR